MGSDFSHLQPGLEQIGKTHSLGYIRLFGSAVQSLKNAHDIDLLIGRSELTLHEHSILMDEFSKLFGKPIDLILPTSKVPGLLVQEIARTSIPLWEELNQGRALYANWISPRLAIAEDELLAFPFEERKAAAIAAQKRLKGKTR